MPYFDHNATTPLSPAAREAMLQAYDRFWHNPSSAYAAAGRAHQQLTQARQTVAELFAVEPDQVLFTSGATEGNEAVLRYWQHSQPEARYACTAIEHPSIREPAQHHWKAERLLLPVHTAGHLLPTAIEHAFQEQPFRFLSLMAANNETGVEQPWQEALDWCRRHGVGLHIDATQWIGKRPLQQLGQADFVVGSGHKFGGPKGVGFLLVHPRQHGFAAQSGGGQEAGRRAGTENLPGILGMVAALTERYTQLEQIQQQTNARDHFEKQLQEQLAGLRILGQEARRLPNTSALLMPHTQSSRWIHRMDRQGFQIANGSACATGKQGPSHVLQAMQIPNEVAARALRISSGPETTSAEWNALGTTLLQVADALQNDTSASDGLTEVIRI